MGLLIESVLLGIGLAMDAFSVSLADGINEPDMSKKKRLAIPFMFALFQFLMPLLGWVFVSFLLSYFTFVKPFIPWIACGLLVYIGGKMVYEGIHQAQESNSRFRLTLSKLILQGIATSIDALSVGFAIANHTFVEAFISCLVIGVVTLFICTGGLRVGFHFGKKLAQKGTLFGGVILIVIGLHILISSFF